MNIEKILHFLIKHNALLIEITVTTILLLAGYLAYRSYRTEEQEESSGKIGSTDMGQLEETLKKLLEKANQVPAANAAATGDSAALVTEISGLKEQLQKKQQEIEQMKSAPPAAGAESQPSGGLSGKEKDDLTAQIGELKRKLEEYDIISADIADLSFYKEENARLQKELAAKGSAPVAAAAAPAIATSAAPTPAAAPVAAPAAPEVAPAAAIQPAATSVVNTSAGASSLDNTTTMVSGGSGATSGGDDKIVVSGGAPAAGAEASSVVASNPPVENVIDDDIMKDFAAAVADAGVAPKPAEQKPADGQNLGELDIDRMVSEVAALPDASHAETVDSLGQEMDPDKLALEASKLSDVKGEEKDLMGQFENFIKKDKT